MRRDEKKHGSTKLTFALAAVGVGVAGVQNQAHAINYVKANNGTALNLAGSYVANSGTPGSSDTITWDSTVTSATSAIIGASFGVQGLVISNPGAAFTINNTTSSTLSIGSSGIDASVATQTFTINPAILVTANQPWKLSNVASKNIVLGGPVDLGGQTVTLTDAGSGFLDVRSTFANGTLQTAGTAPVIGISSIADTTNVTANFSGSVGRILLQPTVAKTVTLSGTSSVNVQVNNAAAVLKVTNAANTYATATVNGGELQFSSIANKAVPSALGLGTNTVVLGGNGTNGTATYTGLVDASVDRAFNFDSRSTSSGIKVLTAGVTLATSGTLGNSNSTVNSSWNFGGAGNITLSGPINDASGVFTTGVIKNDDGILTLSGVANVYAGNTVVNGGTLLCNSVLGSSSTGLSPLVQVKSTATLGGFGQLGKAGTPVSVTLENGAKLSPGASIGTLTGVLGTGTFDIVGAVTPASSASLVYELDTIAASDKLALTTGSLVIGSGLLEFGDLSLTAGGGLMVGDYTLIDTTSAISGTLGASVTGMINPTYEGTLAISPDGQDLLLKVSLIPEPTVLTMVGMSLTGLMLRRRNRVTR